MLTLWTGEYDHTQSTRELDKREEGEGGGAGEGRFNALSNVGSAVCIG